MFLHIFHPQPVLAALGGFSIRWYGLFLAVGALAGFFVVRRLAQRYNLAVNHLDTIFYWLLIGGLIGARLWHVSNEWAFYRLHPDQIIKIWNGGLGIHGAIIAGIIVLWLYSHFKKIGFWLLADILAPGLVLGQVIGRWGNYFNQELFGRPTDAPWGIPIDLANRPLAYRQFEFFHPTFLYESLGNLIIFAMLVGLHVYRLRLKTTANAMAKYDVEGAIAVVYFIVYSVLRIGTESLRIDRTPIIAGVRLPIITSSIVIVVAVLTWFILRRRMQQRMASAGGT